MTGFSASKAHLTAVDPFKVSLVLATLLLMLVTVVNQFLIDPYKPISDPVTIIGPGALPMGSVQPVVLSTAEAGRVIRRDFRLINDRNASHFRVLAEVELHGVEPGNQRWKQARILFNQVQSDGTLYWEPPHVVFRGKGDLYVPDVRTVLSGAPVRQFMNVRVELLLATGEMTVRRLALQPLRVSDGARNSEKFLLVGWLTLFGGWSIFLFLKTAGRKARLPLMLLCWLAGVAVMGLSTLPSGSSQPVFHYIWKQVTWVESMLPKSADPGPVAQAPVISDDTRVARQSPVMVNVSAEEAAAGRFTLSKFAHVGVFVGIGILFGFYGSGRFVPSLSGAILFSLVAELMQTFAINRSPSLFDAGLNTGGAAVGVLVAAILMTLYRRAIRR